MQLHQHQFLRIRQPPPSNQSLAAVSSRVESTPEVRVVLMGLGSVARMRRTAARVVKVHARRSRSCSFEMSWIGVLA